MTAGWRRFRTPHYERTAYGCTHVRTYDGCLKGETLDLERWTLNVGKSRIPHLEDSAFRI
jgi:hypothetical protein